MKDGYLCPPQKDRVMNIVQAEFKGSFPNVSKCPPAQLTEFAFIGRSNVGKSTLINMLTQRRDLAHTSNVPGKTMLLNFYLINEDWYLVDLPGYGYAKRSKKTRAKFSNMIEGYLRERLTMACAFMLIDASIPTQQIDIDFINWMGENGVPFAIVATKIDKKSKNPIEDNIESLRKMLLENWEELPPIFETSALKREGRDEILAYIDDIHQQVEAAK